MVKGNQTKGSKTPIWHRASCEGESKDKLALSDRRVEDPPFGIESVGEELIETINAF